jgi:hypothetical protein
MQSKSLFHPGLLKVEDTFVEKNHQEPTRASGDLLELGNETAK